MATAKENNTTPPKCVRLNKQGRLKCKHHLFVMQCMLNSTSLQRPLLISEHMEIGNNALYLSYHIFNCTSLNWKIRNSIKISLKWMYLEESIETLIELQYVISSWPRDTICLWRAWSTLVHVTACFLTVWSQCLKQCLPTIKEVLWH